MEASIKFYLDDESMECVAQRFFLDGEEVSEEDFEDVCGDIVEILEENVDDFECDCDCCNSEEVETLEEIIDDYVTIIQDTDGCANCTKDALMNFYEEIVEMILGDIEEY